MRNLLVALAGIAAHSAIADDFCGGLRGSLLSMPTKPMGDCLTLDGYYFMHKYTNCNLWWLAWEKWCGCVGYDNVDCAEVEAAMAEVFT